jgi:hypothetical protein
MSSNAHVIIRETAPGMAQITVMRPGHDLVYADAKRTGYDGRWWSCQGAGSQEEYNGRSRTSAVRVWLSSVGVDLNTAKITTTRSY